MRPLTRIIIPAFLSLLLANAVTAQSSQPAGAGLIHRPAPAAATTQRSSATNASDSVGPTRVVVSLTAVVGLIIVVYWASRRFHPRGGISSGGTQAIQVLARVPLSPRHRVILLRIGRRIIVVAEGSGQQQLNTLCEITDPDEAAALLGHIRAEQANSRSFSALLNHAADRFRSAEAAKPHTEPIPDADELASAHQELDGLSERVRVMARQFERA